MNGRRRNDDIDSRILFVFFWVSEPLEPADREDRGGGGTGSFRATQKACDVKYLAAGSRARFTFLISSQFRDSGTYNQYVLSILSRGSKYKRNLTKRTRDLYSTTGGDPEDVRRLEMLQFSRVRRNFSAAIQSPASPVGARARATSESHLEH